MSNITTHILDTSRGHPASGVRVRLEQLEEDGRWTPLAAAQTDADGRIKHFNVGEHQLDVGVYRLIFETGDYFAASQVSCFYPEVTVAFKVEQAAQHYHVPLLLNPYGYSTYRGS